MAASGKFDMPSGSSDRPIHTPRGSYTSSPLDRSGSFHENKDSPILSSLSSMSRSNASVTKGDVTNFLHCLRFDLKSISADYKFARQAEIKRLTNSALGLQIEDYSPNNIKEKNLPLPSLEDLKRLKANLRESSTKARERLKICNEAMSVMNKCFPNIPSRKRSRLDILNSEKASILFSGERPAVGSNLSKVGTQTHAVASVFDFEPPNLEEKVKIALPNKRTRTSLVDVRSDMRASAPARSSANTERETVKFPSTGTVHSEDRALSVGVDNWEKSKLKKKRSGIKPDVSSSSMVKKTTELKQGTQPRLLPDARFRPGLPGGALGVGKEEGIRSSIPKAEQDKETANVRAVNKTNSKEDFSSPSPTSSTKIISTTRAPRSSPTIIHNISPAVQKVTVPNSRKSTAPTQPPSPPVTQWASQRPQKISRTARRTNFNPIISNNNETPPLDATFDFTTNSPQQIKFKGDHFSSPAISESEESGAVDLKSREKIKKSDEVEEKGSPNFQKVSNLPPRKNKNINQDDNGDGVRRKGRTGRGFTSTRSLIPTTGENIGNSGTAKQLRGARLGFEKTENKVGRPPSRKLSDRKPYTRQKQTTLSASADFHDDGHEELLAAAAAVTDPALCFSSPFWRGMEPYFCFISDEDLAFLKQQGNHVLNTPEVPPILNTCSNNPNRFKLNESDRDNNPEILSPGLEFPSFEASICQRLMSAVITEEECDKICNSNDGSEFNFHENGFDNPLNDHLSGNFQLGDSVGLNGYKASANGNANDLDNFLLKKNELLEKELMSDLEVLENDLDSDSDINNSEFQYHSMSLDEKILLELESIGISLEASPELNQTGDEEISEDINRLKDKHLRQVSTAKEAFIRKLFISASETRATQEKEFEQHALDKLLAMAFEKYMACWGPNPSGGKNTSSKMAKQAALNFVKRTLEHCRQFKDTGKSCFSEGIFKDIFISGSSRLRDGLILNGKSVSDFDKQISGGSTDVRVSAARGTQRSPSVNNNDIYSYNPFISANINEDSWTNKVDTIGSLSSTKGKRSEREREGKGSRDASKNATPKSNIIKGERKNKSKPKQKLSASVNGNSYKFPEEPKATMSMYPASSGERKSGNFKQEDEILEEPIDLSHLQLPGIDLFEGPDDLDGQGQDIGSWLNIDEEFPDQDGFDGLNGLEIPMDDLSELNMKF